MWPRSAVQASASVGPATGERSASSVMVEVKFALVLSLKRIIKVKESGELN